MRRVLWMVARPRCWLPPLPAGPLDAETAQLAARKTTAIQSAIVAIDGDAGETCVLILAT